MAETLANPAPTPEAAANPSSPANLIAEDASHHGRSDLAGLYLEGEDNSYLVMDAGDRLQRDVELKPGLLPRLEKHSHTLDLTRPLKIAKETITSVPTVTVGVYDYANDLVDVKRIDRAELYSLANEENLTGGGWLPRQEETADRGAVAVELTGVNNTGKAIGTFQEVTQRLEARSITNWKGLTWERGNTTERIVEDIAIKRRAPSGFGFVWMRSLVVKTTTPQGYTYLQTFSDHHLADYFEKSKEGSAEQRRPVENMRLVINKSEAARNQEQLGAREREMYRYFGAVAMPEYVPRIGVNREEERRSRSIEAAIARQTGADDSPESFADEEDRTALWLLDYSDMLVEESRLDKVAEIIDSETGKRRIKALNEAIDEYGLARVWELAVQLQNDFGVSMKKLDQPVYGLENSRSRVFEALADSFYRGRQPDPGASPTDPFADNVPALNLQLDIVDQLVGQSFTKPVGESDGEETFKKALVQIVEKQVPAKGLNALGQPYAEMKAGLEFNKKRFTAKNVRHYVKKEDRQAQQLRDVIEQPIIDMASALYAKIAGGQAISQAERIQFGRLLRRSVAD